LWHYVILWLIFVPQTSKERKKRKENNREGESKPAFVYWKEGGIKSVGRPLLCCVYYWCVFLVEFSKLWKVAIGFGMSVHLSTWNSAASKIYIFMKFDI